VEPDATDLDRTDEEPAVDEPVVDWRSRVGTAGLLIGSAMIGLDKVLFPEKRKADTEQVTSEPLGSWPRLGFGDAELDQLGPDDEGYWPG